MPLVGVVWIFCCASSVRDVSSKLPDSASFHCFDRILIQALEAFLLGALARSPGVSTAYRQHRRCYSLHAHGTLCLPHNPRDVLRTFFASQHGDVPRPDVQGRTLIHRTSSVQASLHTNSHNQRYDMSCCQHLGGCVEQVQSQRECKGDPASPTCGLALVTHAFPRLGL